MFTGIIEELGALTRVERGEESAVLTVHGPVVCSDARPGDSIAVNGVCLTVVTCADAQFTAQVMRQTLELTGLGELRAGDRVNLERAMAAGGRFGGHLVQGHIDGTGALVQRTPGERCELLTIQVPEHLHRYVVAQGSIALDGVSLTVAQRHPESFTVSLIPTTLDLTTLGHRQIGEKLNVEVDLIGKYVEHFLTARTGQSG